MRCRRFDQYIPDGGVVCDFGCGEDFSFLRSINHRIKKGIGIDKKYQLMCYKNIEIIEDMKKIKDNSVDLVTMIAVLEHLERPIDIIVELQRILKSGGKIVLTTPSPASKPILEFLAYKLKIINKEEILDHKRYFGKRDLYYLFNALSFRNIKHSYFQIGLNNFLEAQK